MSHHDAEREAEELVPWMAAHAAFYGSAPEERPSPGGSSLTFRRRDDPQGLFGRMMGTVGRYAQKPQILAHLEALGFGWSDDEVLLTIPTPASFRRRIRAGGLRAFGFVPEVVALDGLHVPAGAWLARLIRGVLTLNVGTLGLYRRVLPDPARARSHPSARRRMEIIHHLLALPHDMTKHVLTFHLIPRSCLLELGAHAEIALRGPRRWLSRGSSLRHARLLGSLPKEWLAPIPLLTFYENDLVDYCHAVFAAIERPEDFAPTFVRRQHYRQLRDVLARRVTQIGAVGELLRDVPPRPYARFEIDR